MSIKILDAEFDRLESVVVRMEMGWREVLKQHVKEFNRNHSVVIVGGYTRIMRKTAAAADIDGRDGFEFLKPQELNAIYVNTKIKVGEKEDKYGNITDIYKTEFMAWYEHPDSDVYRAGVIFRPGNKKVPEGYFNTWSGFAVKPAKTVGYPLLKQHIESIICNNDRELIKYFYSWVAYTLQRPEIPVGSALVLRGDKGVGKGILGHFLRKIWGRHSLYISQASQITGNFNGHLADVCFLFADEAFFSGDKKHEGTLKALITENKLMIERKGVDPEQQNNYLKLFMVTNNEFAVPATTDERRFCVFDVSDQQIGNAAYFKALKKELNDQATPESFLADMLELDVSKWVASRIPESIGLKEQRMHNMGTPGQWLMDCLNAGEFNDFGWQPVISASDMKKSYLKWCETHKINGYLIVTDTALGRYLSKFFVKKKGQTIDYHVGELVDCISIFEEIEKIYIS